MRSVTCRVALAVAIVLLGVLPAGATTAKYGHTGARDRPLRDGCHDYRYHYVIKTPTNDWTLETFLVVTEEEA